MSKEWDYYDVTCRDCGNTGQLAMWFDDWNRWGTEWTGFEGRVYITGPKPELTRCSSCGGANVEINQRPK